MKIKLTKIEEELNNYIQNIESEFEEILLVKAEEFDQPLYLLKTYYIYMCFIADKPFLSNRHKTDKILFAKTSTDIFGIYNCLKNGCIYQALVICRGLLETNVTAQFIYQDYINRVQLYYDHKYIEKYQQYKKNSENVKENEIQAIKKKYNEIKDKYDDRKPWYSKVLKEILKTNTN